MKKRIQFNGALTSALFVTAAWFALWTVLFTPKPTQSAPNPQYSKVSYIHAGLNTIRHLQDPTRFAFPSKEGFSGGFPEEKVHLKLSLDRSHKQPNRFLENNPIEPKRPEQPHLDEHISLPDSISSDPTISDPIKMKPLERTTLFFSPELHSRTLIENPVLTLENHPAGTVRVHLTIEPDGSVSQTLFDKPANNPELPMALRQMQFSTSPEQSSGWINIQFINNTKK